MIPLSRRPVVDTTGAGDAFVAALVTALIAGRGSADAGLDAVAAASLTAGHLGGRPRLSPEGIAQERASLG